MTRVEEARIEALVKRTMKFALKTYGDEWEAALSLLAAGRLIAMKAGIDWDEMVVAVVEMTKGTTFGN